MESELHSAAIDTDIYEKEIAERAAHENNCSLRVEATNEVIWTNDKISDPIFVYSLIRYVFQILSLAEYTRDEIDALPPLPAIDLDTSNDQTERLQVNVSTIQLVDVASTIFAEADNAVQSSKDLTDVKTWCEKPAEVKESNMQNAFKEVRPFTDQQLASLYHNQELMLVDTFVTEFTETQLRCGPLRQQHRLHELLMSYLRVRNHLIANSYELDNLKKNCRETQKRLWYLEKTSLTESGECQDGNPVTATHEYSIAHFNHQTLIALSRSLSAIKDTLHNSQALYCYEAESLRLQIEHYVQRVARSFSVSHFSLNKIIWAKKWQTNGWRFVDLILINAFTFRNSPTFRRPHWPTFYRSNHRPRQLRSWWSSGCA